MDISKCNDAQRAVIETLPGPLFVAAGAGSGKTFTLKLRTANAFLPNSSGFKLDSIDQVLAITFTNAAAEELLSRIKDALLAEGLTQQAFDADGAWISTIHGFCSRFLRENALEIGLDPAFRMITELEAQEMEAATRAWVFQEAHEGRLDLSSVAWNWSLINNGAFDGSLIDDAEELLSRLAAMPQGFDAFVHMEPAVSPKDALLDMVAVSNALLDMTLGWEKINGNTERKSLDKLPDAMTVAAEWLASDQADLALDAPGFDAPRFRAVLSAFPALPQTFGKGKDGKGVVSRYKRTHMRVVCETDGAFGMQAAEVALVLARAMRADLVRRKREAGVVDNDDLLRMTLDALREHPHLAARYRDRFQLIMVDEFQDTDKVQIEILKHIARPRLANVCVVGDAQQSIYRFRGADVGAFMDYRNELASAFPQVREEELQPKLAQNFRSHADILAFVDSIFSQECSFGKAYLQLSPQGAVNDVPDPVMDERPRVTMDIVHHRSGSDLGTQALHASARRIARHFADIKRAYAEAGVHERQSYALLLGKTKNAQVYMDALREEGLESMMTSGSMLMSTDEAAMVMALLRHALNTRDDQPLLDCLTSDLFAVSDDVLLAMAYRMEDGRPHHASLSQGFARGSFEEFGLSEGLVEPVRFAREVLARFVRRARRESLAEAVRAVLVESGYLDRMQGRGVVGLASVGNCSKLIDILKGVEREQSGLAKVVSAFAAKTLLAKESPGILSVSEAEFVQIMTIHGSKGLQFDHVVLADIKNGKDVTRGMMAENEGSATFAISKKGMLACDKLRAEAEASLDERGMARLHAAKSPGELLPLLSRISKAESMDEARRLLYVGLTRAVRSVYLSYVTSSLLNTAKGKEPYGGDGVMHDVYEAFEWDVMQKRLVDVENYPYGGSSPARILFEQVEGDEEERFWDGYAPIAERDAGPETLIIVRREVPDMPVQVPFRGDRANVRSYSSLDHDAASEPLERTDVVVDAEGEADARILMREVGEDATALGTAFHRLVERAILRRNMLGAPLLEMPDEAAIRAQEDKLALSAAQRERLAHALAGWFASPEAAELCTYASVDAEVPFMVRVEGPEGQPLFLEGEIDALAATGDMAYLVDYKTGGSVQETDEQLHAKHALQAQCYAYALLRNGFAEVRATFVRVEQRASDGGPQTVVYRFDASDVPDLEAEIISRWPGL